MAILAVEQYFAWARDDDYAVMDRGAIVVAGTRAEMAPRVQFGAAIPIFLASQLCPRLACATTWRS